MNNPYTSPGGSPHEMVSSPRWYFVFYKLYWPAWWLGTALIVGSWFGMVSPRIGWIGFALTGAAALGSYVLPSIAGTRSEDYVLLDSRLIKTKGEAYRDAIQRFRHGASLIYDGVAFGFRPNNEIACGVVADPAELDDSAATDIATHASIVFDQLVLECTEFAAAVAGRTIRISILSSSDAHARELCRVVNERLDWHR